MLGGLVLAAGVLGVVGALSSLGVAANPTLLWTGVVLGGLLDLLGVGMIVAGRMSGRR